MENLTRLASAADDYQQLTILDLLRRDLKAKGDLDKDDSALLANALYQRLVTDVPAKPSEELVLAIVQLLVELVHAGVAVPQMDGLVNGVLRSLHKDRVRRAAAVLITALLKKAPEESGNITDAIVTIGVGNLDVSYGTTVALVRRLDSGDRLTSLGSDRQGAVSSVSWHGNCSFHDHLAASIVFTRCRSL